MEPVAPRIRWPSRTFLKYLVVQIPGWLLIAGLMLLLGSRVSLSAWWAGGLVGLAVAKDLVLYPLLRRAYEGDPRTGAEFLIGSRGSVARALAPEGYVRVKGELWRATTETTSQMVPEGTPVKISGARGLTVTVEPD